jgi:hypothetical protein
MSNLAPLMAKLDALEAALPALRADHPDDGDFLTAFAGMADVIEDQAGEHASMVSGGIDGMLAAYREE